MYTCSHLASVINHPACAAQEVESALARFPLILDILGHLQTASVPLPGDSDLHHGCQRALTAMLASLSRIEPSGNSEPPEWIQETLQSIHGPQAARLVDADQLQRFQQLIERWVGKDWRHH